MRGQNCEFIILTYMYAYLLSLFIVIAYENQTESNDRDNIEKPFNWTLCCNDSMNIRNDEGNCTFWWNETFSEEEEALNDTRCLLFLSFNENYQHKLPVENTKNVIIEIKNTYFKFMKHISSKNFTKEPKDKRQFLETCENGTKCTGNLTCEQTGEGHKLCHCPNGMEFFNGSCLRVNMPINSTCQVHFQCALYGDKTFCSSDGFCTYISKSEQWNNTCYGVDRVLGAPCDEDLQCTGTKYAGLCGQNKTCSCDQGYMQINNTCAKEDRILTYWTSVVIWVFEGIACFLVGVCCTTGILKRIRKSSENRAYQNRLVRGSLCREYSVSGDRQQVPLSAVYCELSEEIIPFSRDSNREKQDATDDVYNHLHEKQEGNTTTDNVYGIPKP